MGVVYKGDLKAWGEMTTFLDAYALPAAEVKDKSDKPRSVKVGVAESAVQLTSESLARARSAEEAWLVLYHSLAAPSASSWAGAAAWEEVARKCGRSLVQAGEVNCTAAPQNCKHVKLKGKPLIEVMLPLIR